MKKSTFDLTHEKKLTMDMGKLVPILYEEVLPGEEFEVKTDMLVRLAPMLAPMMHRVNVYVHYYFYPSRLAQTDWDKFITGGEDGTDATAAPLIKSPASTGYAKNTLWDYFGLPVGVPDFEVLAYLFRGYADIYNQWYRDQNLIAPVVVSRGNGLDTTTSRVLLDRAWEKDRFTGALPWAQRGTPVTIPIGGQANVTLVPYTTDTTPMAVQNAATGAAPPGNIGVSAQVTTGNLADAGLSYNLAIDPKGRLKADLSGANPITINAFRQLITLQKWMEKQARGGSRLVETILEHFGQRSSDARLQRPEYLGGGVSPITVSEVLQTSATGAVGTPLGAMAGHGYSVPGINAFKKSFEEHGYIIGIMSVLPRTAYQQGSAVMWNRRSRLDFPWPTFAGIGEQAILKKEVYADAVNPDSVWGYAPRYQELRERESSVHGDFRDTMDYWTMVRKFASPPTLSSAFVSADPTKRIFAAPSEAGLWVQVLNQVHAKRPIPLVAKPGVVGI